MTSKVRRQPGTETRWAPEDREEPRAVKGYPGTTNFPDHESDGPDYLEIDDTHEGYHGPSPEESVQTRVADPKLSAFTKRVLELTDHKTREQPKEDIELPRVAAVNEIQRPDKARQVQQQHIDEENLIRRPMYNTLHAGDEAGAKWGKEQGEAMDPGTRQAVARAIEVLSRKLDPKAFAENNAPRQPSSFTRNDMSTATSQQAKEDPAVQSPMKVQPSSPTARNAAVGTYNRAWSPADEAQRRAQHGSGRARDATGGDIARLAEEELAVQQESAPAPIRPSGRQDAMYTSPRREAMEYMAVHPDTQFSATHETPIRENQYNERHVQETLDEAGSGMGKTLREPLQYDREQPKRK